MNSRKITAIDDFLILSDLFNDDQELIANFIYDTIPKSLRRYKLNRILNFILEADYIKLHKEVLYLLELDCRICINYKILNERDYYEEEDDDSDVDDYTFVWKE